MNSNTMLDKAVAVVTTNLAKVKDLGMPISTLTADSDQFKTGTGKSQMQM